MCARIRHRCLISTHAPHAGSDVAPTPTPQPTTISTHAPHAGSDADNVYNAISAGQFQPTLPMRGATNYKPHYWRFCRFQPTLPMRGATSLRLLFFLLLPISTHAPHAGSDTCVRNARRVVTIFQPTLPMRGATASEALLLLGYIFQPTLPMRGATLRERVSARDKIFQPTLPMRGATKGRDVDVKLDVFQPTLPMRGATVTPLRILTPTKISTHAPHAGSDTF